MSQYIEGAEVTDHQRELIDRLRRECEELVDGDVEETQLEDVMLVLLPEATGDAEFDDAIVRGAIDELAVSSEHVSVEDRRRLTAAARQGARHNRRLHQPLQLVLEAARAERGLDSSAVAEALRLLPELLVAYEAGNRPLSQLEPRTLALWVDQLSIPAEVAERAVVRSFSLAGSGARFGGRQRGAIDAAARGFIDSFLAALGELRSSKQS